MQISSIYVYPIKSLGGISLLRSEVTERGLALDRRWILVDENNVFLTQRNIAEMALFKLAIESDCLIVSFELEEIKIPFKTSSQNKEIISIWDDKLEAVHVGKIFDNWFSDRLKLKCKLFYQPEYSIRKIDEKYSITGNEHTNLADGYPILIVSEASLADLNSKCPEFIEMIRFRPNIVIKNSKAFEEDNLEKFNVGNTLMYGVKPCARCILTTINPKTLEKSKEPLLTLSTYRKINNKIHFGQNVLVHEVGEIKIGDFLISNWFDPLLIGLFV